MSIQAADYQKKLLLELSAREYQIPEEAKLAFMRVPRHLFVDRYFHHQQQKWIELDQEKMEEHFAYIYSNSSLWFFEDVNTGLKSTISQPSLVLSMLGLLDLKPGQKVFEVGAGSGWNAKLMAEIVGEEGQVYTSEIISSLASRTKWRYEKLGINNIEVINGDGGKNFKQGVQFDRIVFTAGAYEIPNQFIEQLKPNGKLLAVIKIPGGGDSLFLFRKEGEKLVSLKSFPVSFLPMLGVYENQKLDPILLEETKAWERLKEQESRKMSYWWSDQGNATFMRRTFGIRAFFSIKEPNFQMFKGSGENKNGDLFFGLWNESKDSLAVAKFDTITNYGKEDMIEKMIGIINEWVEKGMPIISNFKLEIVPKGWQNDHQECWINSRSETDMVWTL